MIVIKLQCFITENHFQSIVVELINGLQLLLLMRNYCTIAQMIC